MGFFELFSGALAAIYSVIPSYGLAIVALTLVTRLLLLPLTIKQTRSQREMQLVQPQVRKIQAKYKGQKTPQARQKMNEEVMGLYKEHGVNPLGGCLPLLLQMPVFIALFRVLSQPLAYMGYALEEGSWAAARGASGVMESVQQSDLARGLLDVPDKINTFLGVIRLDCSATAAFGEPRDLPGAATACDSGFLAALPYLLLIALMGLTTLYQQKQMTATRDASGDPQAAQQQAIMKFMPLLFVVFGFGFPAGLTVYWTTSNLWAIVQQYLMLRVAPPLVSSPGAKADKGASDARAAGKKPAPGKPPKKATQKPAAAGPEADSGSSAASTRPSRHRKKKKKR